MPDPFGYSGGRPSQKQGAQNMRALQALTRALDAEVAAFLAVGRCLPRVRMAELFDVLLPLLSEQQRSWDELPADRRALIDDARARMLEAMQRLDVNSVPSMASRPCLRPYRPRGATTGTKVQAGRRSKWDFA